MLMLLQLFVSLLFTALQVNALSDEECSHSCQLKGTCQVGTWADTCLFAFRKNETWKETKEFCQSQNLTMVKLPKEDAMNESLAKELSGIVGSSFEFWLGGRARDLGNWTFVNGMQLNVSETSNSDKFNNLTLRHMCGTLLHIGTSLKVKIAKCYNNRQFVCRTGNDQPISQSLFVSVEFNTWYEARSRCITLGGDLFYLKPREKMQDIRNEFFNFKNKVFFIGLRHEIWEWQDEEEILDFNWKTDEPSSSSERCLMLRTNGSYTVWNDANCNTSLNIICQRVIKKSSTLKPDAGSGIAGPISTSIAVIICVLGGLLVSTILVIALLLACFMSLYQKNQMTSSNANEFVRNPIFAGSPEHKPEANSVTTVDRLQLKTTPDLPSGDVIDPVDNSQYGEPTDTTGNNSDPFESYIVNRFLDDDANVVLFSSDFNSSIGLNSVTDETEIVDNPSYESFKLRFKHPRGNETKQHPNFELQTWDLGLAGASRSRWAGNTLYRLQDYKISGQDLSSLETVMVDNLDYVPIESMPFIQEDQMTDIYPGLGTLDMGLAGASASRWAGNTLYRLQDYKISGQDLSSLETVMVDNLDYVPIESSRTGYPGQENSQSAVTE